MQQNFMFFDKRFDIGQRSIRLLVIIFVVALIAKGPVLFRGFGLDDYQFMASVGTSDLEFFLSQGRFIGATTIWVADSLGANINDMYFSLGLMALFLQAVFVVSILRFVGMGNFPSAGLIGAIMIAHPYLTEIFTCRMLLPYYSVALIFSIIAFEMVIRSPASLRARALALLATFAMLMTYQSFLNYFAVAIIFAFINGQVLRNKNVPSLATNNVYRERAITLTTISAISTIAFLSIIRLTKALGLTGLIGKATIISFDKIPERIKQISSSLVNIYLSAEPVFPVWPKTLVALMLILSVGIIFKYLFTATDREHYISKILVALFSFLLLIPVSLGVIVAFNDWEPAPRIIAHVAIITGLIFLTADKCMQDSGNCFLKQTIFIFRIVILVGFVFLSNQLLADQQRINQWDRMMANRIISRLEMYQNFHDVRFVHISEGFRRFPAKLRTYQENINYSAFFKEWSSVWLLSEVSGYRFEKAEGSRAVLGETYCNHRQPWPHAESVTVDNDLAIICLKK